MGSGELFYYRTSYYDPLLKIFTSDDSIGLRGGLNSTAYVNLAPRISLLKWTEVG